MLERILLVILLCAAAGSAAATDYTDIWYNPAESGWGVTAVQSNNFIFLTFFIYGPDNKPTWYVASVTQDVSGNFNGPLSLANGTYFAMPWVVPVPVGIEVGTASFQPTSSYTANLIYTVSGVGTVSKAIQRQALRPINIDGSYTGGLNLSHTGCASGGSGTLNVDINVTQPANNNGPTSIVVNYLVGQVCTFTGNLTAFGKLYQMSSAAYTCSGPSRNTTARLDEIAKTAHGIEGIWSATVEDGCTESGTFAAVLKM